MLASTARHEDTGTEATWLQTCTRGVKSHHIKLLGVLHSCGFLAAKQKVRYRVSAAVLLLSAALPSGVCAEFAISPVWEWPVLGLWVFYESEACRMKFHLFHLMDSDKCGFSHTVHNDFSSLFLFQWHFDGNESKRPLWLKQPQS